MNNQAAKKWEPNEVENLDNKTMVVLGFGSIGSACGKLAKNGFGVKVIGVDKSPVTDPLRISSADEIIELEKLQTVIPEADFFVSVLPYTKLTDKFLN